MRKYQDDYWKEVGITSGLARVGPAKRRLTRAEWQAEKSASQNTAELLKIAVDAEQKIMTAQTAVAAAHRADQAAYKAEAVAASSIAALQVKTAESLVAVNAANAQREQIIQGSSRIGVRLRGLFAGWWQASPDVIANRRVILEKDSWKYCEARLLQERSRISKRIRELEGVTKEFSAKIAVLVRENLQLGRTSRLEIGPRLKERAVNRPGM